MKKKTYIAPTLLTFQVHTTEALLTLSGGETLGNGGYTDGNVTESDSKFSGDWNIWDDGGDDIDTDY